MNIHRRLIVLVGLGMLLIMIITVLSLENITTVFTGTTRSVGQISLEVKKIWNVEQKIGDAARMVHLYVGTGDAGARTNYETFHNAVIRMLKEIETFELPEQERKVLGALVNDFHAMETKAGQIFSLDLEDRGQRALAVRLLVDLDNLIAWMDHDFERYKEESTIRLDAVAREINVTRVRINILFGIILITSAGYLALLGTYLYRKVSLPLAQLWEGAEAISRGDLDYRMEVRGESDIVKLSERFNEMAQKLKVSYADLEQRLLERTKQVGALNSVALTLGARGTLREVLQRSLATVLENFPDMEPRGGIFLCDPDGESLRLTAHSGLPPEFVAREERIRLGECLCGTVAQTGEMIFSESGCPDPRHTRPGHPGHAHIVIPITSRGVVLGVMFLYPQRQFVLKPSDVQMFDTIGAQLGMAVENIRLYGEVKESSEKFWELFEKSRDILFTVDLDGKLTAVNEAMERFAGSTKPELVGRNVLEFLNDEGRVLARKILGGGEPLTGRLFEFEIMRPGLPRAYLEVSGRTLFLQSRPVGFHAAARDVTEQKGIRELLVQAERLAAIGQVVVAVRHEINNPLTTVIGNIELLQERYERTDPELKRRLGIVLENALRISEIVKRLQEIREDRTVEYTQGVKMTDLGKE